MPIIVACPSCGTRLRAPEEMIGQDVKCARCATVFPAIEASGSEPSIARHWSPSQDPSSVPNKSTYSFQDPEPRSHDRDEVEPPSQMWREDDRNDYDDEDNEFRRRRRRRSEMGQNNIVMSVASVVLGIVCIPLFCLCGPLSLTMAGCALLTGGISVRSENAKVLAILGIALGVIGVLLNVVMLVVRLSAIANRGP